MVKAIIDVEEQVCILRGPYIDIHSQYEDMCHATMYTQKERDYSRTRPQSFGIDLHRLLDCSLNPAEVSLTVANA